MQKPPEAQICVYLGKQKDHHALLTPVNEVYQLVVGQYFCIEVLLDQQPRSSTWHGEDTRDMARDYTVSVQTATLIPQPHRHDANLFTGFWWKPGNKEIHITTDTRQFTLRFRISAPQMQTMFNLVKIGKPTIGMFSIPLSQNPKLWLVLAGPESQTNRQLQGFALTYCADLFAHGGTLACIQLIKTSRIIRLADGKVSKHESNVPVLDNGRTPTSYLYSDEKPLTSTTETMIDVNDGPAQELDNTIVSATVSEQFQTFLMFKPAGNLIQANWVPLACIHWGWSATASPQGTNWVLSNPISFASVIVDVTTGDIQNAFPTWTTNVLSLPHVMD
jgi:hypothetical protein